MLIVGILIGCACTGLAAGVIAEWQARHAYPPEPQRVTPQDIRPLTDGLAALAHGLRLSHSRGAAEVTAIGHQALNLERRARSEVGCGTGRLGDLSPSGAARPHGDWEG